mmetsp:Transcript_8178/g.20111  ORF Transcript_8178/g.20111 Transcript_8178/m.20111 type:complete len:90 (-) Transcript_8178:183-452(-)
MRRIHVIIDGEEHGSQVAVVYPIRAPEVQVRTEIIAIGEDEYIDEDEDVQRRPGAFAGAGDREAAHSRCSAAKMSRKMLSRKVARSLLC